MHITELLLNIRHKGGHILSCSIGAETADSGCPENACERENDERWAELCAWWRLSFHSAPLCSHMSAEAPNSALIQKLWSHQHDQKHWCAVDKALHRIHAEPPSQISLYSSGDETCHLEEFVILDFLFVNIDSMHLSLSGVLRQQHPSDYLSYSLPSHILGGKKHDNVYVVNPHFTLSKCGW